MSIHVIQRTRVIQKKTGRVLGFCDLPYVGGYYLMRPLISQGPFFMVPYSRDGLFKRIHQLYYRWKLSVDRPPEIIAHGLRDAKYLRGFREAGETE